MTAKYYGDYQIIFQNISIFSFKLKCRWMLFYLNYYQSVKAVLYLVMKTIYHCDIINHNSAFRSTRDHIYKYIPKCFL